MTPLTPVLDAVRREELRKLVEVKPLEWKQNWPNDPLSAFAIAAPISRAYTIEHDSPRFYVTSQLWAGGEVVLGVANCSSLEEAKAAAQADYESRILAALLPKASVREEPDRPFYPLSENEFDPPIEGEFDHDDEISERLRERRERSSK